MLAWIKNKWRKYQERKRLMREIAPKSFQELAREMRDLAEVAERLLPNEQTTHAKIKRIQSEIEQLDRLIMQPEFRKLPPEKRLERRKSIIQSREQLIETIHTAPSPTATLQ